MRKKNKLFGFTLVELIVVITIVGILSTVGFVSYSGYLSGARDSNRISQLTKLSDSLQVYSASKSLPLPDDYIEIQASGSLIAYQGYVGVDVLETIDYTNGGTDPKDDTYYTYYLTRDRKSLQLMAMMEEQSSTAFHLPKSTNAINYEERYPKVYGKKLGVITEQDTNTPLQEIPNVSQNGFFNIFNETGEYSVYIDNDKIISGTTSEIGSFLLLSSNTKNIDNYKSDDNLIVYFDFDISQDSLANSNIAIDKIGNFNIIKDNTKGLVYECDGSNRIVIGSGSTIIGGLSEYTFYASYKLDAKQNNSSPKVVASYGATGGYNLFCQNGNVNTDSPNIGCYVRINEEGSTVSVGGNSSVKYPRFEDILITQKEGKVLTAYNRNIIGTNITSGYMNNDSGQGIGICARPRGGYNMTGLIDKIYISKKGLKTQDEINAFYTLMNQ